MKLLWRYPKVQVGPLEISVELTKREKKVWADCSGYCRVCLWDGGCTLQHKLEAKEKELRPSL